jgi:hypothetical protein
VRDCSGPKGLLHSQQTLVTDNRDPYKVQRKRAHSRTAFRRDYRDVTDEALLFSAPSASLRFSFPPLHHSARDPSTPDSRTILSVSLWYALDQKTESTGI